MQLLPKILMHPCVSITGWLVGWSVCQFTGSGSGFELDMLVKELPACVTYDLNSNFLFNHSHCHRCQYIVTIIASIMEEGDRESE